MRRLMRWALLGAWLFVGSSTLALFACAALAWRGGNVRLMGAPALDGSWSSAIFAYRGRAGAFLALALAVVVALAAFAARMRPLGARRAGWTILVAWAALWSIHAVRWWAIDADAVSSAIAAAVLLSAGCVAISAWSGSRRPSARVAKPSGRSRRR